MDRTRELARIARLYYLQNLSQREIADRLGTSVATVSRALAQARQQGVVTFQINVDREALAHNMESVMEDRYGLDECRVADPALPVLDGIAGELAGVLSRFADGATRIGVSWGTTLKGLGERLAPLSANGAQVVPLLGGMGRQDTGVFPNSIARSFAVALGCMNTLVNFPAVVDTAEVRSALLKDSSFSHVRSLWNQVDVAIFSVSSLTTEASIHTTGLFSTEELERLRHAGAVAALNFNFLDADGKPVETELGHRLVCASMETIDKAPRRIMVAYGADKLAAIQAALAGNHATVLITDTETASSLASSARP